MLGAMCVLRSHCFFEVDKVLCTWHRHICGFVELIAIREHRDCTRTGDLLYGKSLSAQGRRAK